MDKITNTFVGLTNLQKILVLIILALVFYGASASVSYSLFNKVKPITVTKEGATSQLPNSTNGFVEDPAEPKTEICPLNGSKHTKAAKA